MKQDYKQLNPKNYDLLWLVYNSTIFYISFWLHKKYLNNDFLIIGENKKCRTYISKVARKQLAVAGLNFYCKNFNTYKKEVSEYIKRSKHKLQLRKEIELKKISNAELGNEFLQLVKFVQRGWKLFWYTEYFFYDKIDKIVIKESKRNKTLLKKVELMKALKYKLREQCLNKTAFIKNKDYVFKPFLAEIARRTRIKDLYQYQYQELLNLLNDKKIPKTDRINWVWGAFNGWKILYGKQALWVIHQFKVNNKKISEISGQVANPGFYRGLVRIINFDEHSNIEKKSLSLKLGEVLVTGSTIPQMIVACRNAGAIITEEGGITSHAAIISRELNKPCVIGTKIATQVFKDGDLVEVDATKGIIKKLK